jgi:D-3-phosphoglycerate dehydrogenase
MLITLLRHIASANNSVKSGYWLREKHRGRELAGLTVGVIGCGNTGRAFASKFAGWQTNVLTYDKYKTHYVDDLRFVTESSLEEVLAQSDVISLHVPLTEETMGMVNYEFIERCKDGVILMNASRGKVVDTRSLIEALDKGKVSGACLDVLSNEKLATLSRQEKNEFEALCARENVIMTPHIAGWSFQSRRNIATQMIDSLQLSD